MPRNTTTRTGLRVLQEGFDLLPGAASLDDFIVTPPSFRPQRNGTPVTDGEPLTRFGSRARDAIAEANDIDPASVPDGLVRLLELVSADDHMNERTLTNTRLLRNRLGTLICVPFVALSVFTFPWLINGRALQRMARRVRERTRLLTTPVDHDLLKLPVIEVIDVDQIMDHYTAQREILGLHEYSGEDRDFVDDIAMNGVLEDVVLTPTLLQGPSGAAWTAQATDGARRVTAEHEIIRRVTGENPALFQRAWRNPQGAPALIHVTADSIRRLHEEATFPHNDLQLFSGASSDQALTRWRGQIADQVSEVAIFQRVRTVQTLLVLAARPNALESSPSQVILEDVRARHIQGATREAWDDAAVRSQITVGCIEQLHRDGVLSDAERDVAIGNAEVPWRDDSSRGPFRNRLSAVAWVSGLLTATSQGRNVLNEHLRLNHQWPHPGKRSRAVSDQALVMIGREGEKQADQIAAAMDALLKSPKWWKTEQHPASESEIWPELLEFDLDELVAQATAELSQPITPVDPAVDSFGPARRALGLLGGLALIVNPKLVDYEYTGHLPGQVNTGGQLSQSGRGGRLRYTGPSLPAGVTEAPVGMGDPSSVISAMLKRLEGIEQLKIAVHALIGEPDPELPLHPETGELLDDAYLRYQWLGTAAPGGGNDSDADPIAQYHQMVAGFFEHLLAGRDSAKEIRDLRDDLGRFLFREIGLTPEQITEGEQAVSAIQRFIIEGGLLHEGRS